MRMNKGFTLIELMMVIAIIMILSGAIVARVSVSKGKAKLAKARAEIEEIATACRAFYMDTDLWPKKTGQLTNKPVADNGYNDDMDLKPFGANTWKGPYLEVETPTSYPKDPWGNPYAIDNDAAKRKLYVTAGGEHTDINVLVHIYNKVAP